MFSLVRELGLRSAIEREGVPFLLAFAMAEMFYKFKSFGLECGAFLLTWFALSIIQSWIFPRRRS